MDPAANPVADPVAVPVADQAVDQAPKRRKRRTVDVVLDTLDAMCTDLWAASSVA